MTNQPNAASTLISLKAFLNTHVPEVKTMRYSMNKLRMNYAVLIHKQFKVYCVTVNTFSRNENNIQQLIL